MAYVPNSTCYVVHSLSTPFLPPAIPHTPLTLTLILSLKLTLTLRLTLTLNSNSHSHLYSVILSLKHTLSHSRTHS